MRAGPQPASRHLQKGCWAPQAQASTQGHTGKTETAPKRSSAYTRTCQRAQRGQSTNQRDLSGLPRKAASTNLTRNDAKAQRTVPQGWGGLV